ncbi:MAG: HAD family hydrolase [Clostridia bacterium]|nr:HAD family hydrolase [Clostridia bacterium]
MNYPYKAVITDLDRTLLHTDKTVSGYTLQIMKRLKQSGVILLAATARPKRAVAEYNELLEFDAITTLNGARTVLKDAEYGYPLSTAGAKSVLKQMSAMKGAVISVETNHGIFANTDIPLWQPVVTDRIETIPDTETVNKLLFSHPEIPVGEWRFDLPEDTYFSIADGKLMQIMNRKATKWNGIQIMLEAFGIAPEDSIYFGDDNDDIEPLKHCGYGVAVSNALEAVKAAADAIGESNDEDGVAHFLNRLFDEASRLPD